MNFIDLFSVLIEAAVVAISVLMATRKKHVSAWLLAVTFSIYVIFDLNRYLNLNLNTQLLDIAFLIASLSALTYVYWLYHKKTLN